MEDSISLNVNGKNYPIQVEPDTPLLYSLRNNLLLNGPKYGCGHEFCGSCMVLMNGKAMPSCRMSSSIAAKFKIITLEGLGKPEQLHPVQQAFIEEQAGQCGYCMNGMIICATALLEVNHNPTDDEIKLALQRVLCRCGSHTRVINAVRRAATFWKR